MECGAALVEAAPTRVVASEKKQITVLFADVAGSMDLQEELDAEVWAGIMGRFVAILAEGVRKYGGTVDKFTGDGIMALFGAPVAQEDHARRACHAANHLTKAIGRFSDELRPQGVELQVRLGLNSGEVVVGRVGNDETLDPTALGHTVGLAQRMEGMADPGRAYLTEHTARLVEGWFSLDTLGPTAVKGSRVPVGVCVLGPAVSVPKRRTIGASRLVGRDGELRVLEKALAMAEASHAQVVGVVGEAGVGKSRLCEEFADHAPEGVIVRRTTGVSHARDVPLLPILGLLRDYFAITDSDDAAQARSRITQRVLNLDPALEESLPLLFDVLEVPDPARPPPQLAPEVRQRRIFEALRRLTQRRSERQLLILVVEDLHWFDPQSEAFLERLIESFPGSRTLVVTNFRPEFRAPWMRHSFYRRLPLAPLPDDAVETMLAGLVGRDSSVEPLVPFVLERTGGNPFFVEEVVRALVQNGTLVGQPGQYRLTRPLQDIRVPPSVQAVVAARIDHLQSLNKALLQTAAVIGRHFSAPLLSAVSGATPEKVDEALSALCAAELVQAVGGDEYRFWHPLTQEVAYSTQLSQERTATHAAVARALAADAERRPELAALVAFHLERACEPVEAARWHDREGTRVWSRVIDDAIARWLGALELLETAPLTEECARVALRIHAQVLRVGARVSLPRDRFEQHYHEARRLAEHLGDETAAMRAEYGYGVAEFVRGGPGRVAVARTMAVNRFAEQTGDVGLQTAALQFLGILRCYVGPISDGLRHVEELTTVVGGSPDVVARQFGFSPLIRALLYGSELLCLAGQLEEAGRQVEAALKLAHERSEVEAEVMAVSALARRVEFTGEQEGSPLLVRQAIRAAEDSGNVVCLVMILRALGIVESLIREPRAAEAPLLRALQVARTSGPGLFEEAGILADLATVRWQLGSVNEAEAAANEAVEVARTQGASVMECRTRLARARIWGAAGRGADATGELHVALGLVHETGAVTYEPFIREELARLEGDERELGDVLRLYRQIGATGHARRLETELGAEV